MKRTGPAWIAMGLLLSSCIAWAADEPVAPRSAGGLTLTLALDRAICSVGDEAAAEVRLENGSGSTASVLELLLESRSLTIEIRTESKPDVTWTVTRPNVFSDGHAGPLRIPLAAKRSLVSVIPIPLVRAGKTTLTAVYKGGPSGTPAVASNAVTLEVKAGAGPELIARIETSIEKKDAKGARGVIAVQLDADVAPLHVMNFVLLARQGFYDRQPFYRVIPDYAVMTGCPHGTGEGDPGWNIVNEHKPDQRHVKGSVSMNHFQGQPGSAGSQFFICVKDAPWLDLPEERYTIFGKVIEGLETVDEISRMEADARTHRPVKPVNIVHIGIGVIRENP